LLEEGAVHLIVVRQFCGRAEETDLDEGSGDEVSAITQSAPPDNHLLGSKVHHLRM
jgi:hypothetical protein